MKYCGFILIQQNIEMIKFKKQNINNSLLSSLTTHTHNKLQDEEKYHYSS